MKRLTDFVFALLLFVPLWLFISIISVLILLIDHFSPFHLQQRVGKRGRLFTCYKLQTMRPPQAISEIGEREKDAVRLTGFGSIIRDHGWDELPQIINVLLGIMSFIGPRPLLLKTYQRIETENQDMIQKIREWEQLRQQMRPGVSGWHQIHIKEKASIIDYDLEYLRNPSIGKHLQILWITMLVFIFGKERLIRIQS